MFGVDKLSIKINSLRSNTVRTKYSADLKKALNPFKSEFTDLELMRLNKNPLRVLDSKNEKIKSLINTHAPNIFDYISDEEREKIWIEYNTIYIS